MPPMAEFTVLTRDCCQLMDTNLKLTFGNVSWNQSFRTEA